jgi:hypothetical protein
MSPDAPSPESADGGEVLSSLPRYRPGRRTVRRSSPGTRRSAAPAAGSDGDVPSAPGGEKQAVRDGRRGARAADRRSPGSGGRARASGPVRAGGPAPVTDRTRRSGRPRRSTGAPRASATEPTSIPEQGFETEEEVRSGAAVEPPSRVELASSLIDLVGEGVEELAKMGLSAGGALFRRTLGSLPKR